ncbi:MAG: hypothetical protein COW58_07150 [Thalassolituus sp. CG17_big_fil_post_rev_8_21_14_2_50_53_8]|nr:MAG: hypothetical protein COW58_07150 [Thalassolituus sp. CG17_big_fil_post_rev_8_21_14_2_50_53_8]
MFIYSKKSRRRMHAIPAAIALLVVTLFWLFSGAHKAQAETVFSATELSSWSVECEDCHLEAQYDVIVGDVVRLESREHLALQRSVKEQPTQPQLSWRWSVDRSVDSGPLVRVSIYLQDTDDWPERIIHYVWDSSREAGSHEALSDFEYLIVATGLGSKAERWEEVSADLNADWQKLYNEPLPPLDHLEVALGMPEQDIVAGAFIEKISLTSAQPEPQPQPAIAINE